MRDVGSTSAEKQENVANSREKREVCKESGGETFKKVKKEKKKLPKLGLDVRAAEKKFRSSAPFFFFTKPNSKETSTR